MADADSGSGRAGRFEIRNSECPQRYDLMGFELVRKSSLGSAVIGRTYGKKIDGHWALYISIVHLATSFEHFGIEDLQEKESAERRLHDKLVELAVDISKNLGKKCGVEDNTRYRVGVRG